MVTTLSTQFIGQSLHFGVNLFAGLACLAAGWLYLDAWAGRRALREFAKGAGFLLLTISFLVSGAAWGDPGFLDFVANILRLTGYLAIAWSLLADPLMPRPKTTGYMPAAVSAGQLSVGANALLPFAAASVCLLYARRAGSGLERHLKLLAFTFGTFALSDLLSLTSLWQHDPNPLLQPLAAPLGPLWFLQHLVLVVATVILGSWVGRYLAKRLLSELFLTISGFTFAIVLAATVSVSALLLGNLTHDALTSLQTATKVLGYAIDSKTADTRTDAEVLAQNPAAVQGVIARDHAALSQTSNALLVDKKLSEAVITDETGVVLARASDPERYGDSLSDDPLVQHALLGATTSSITNHFGALAPTLVISTASPIRSGGQIIGLALASIALDNNFVDGLKHTTGLDSTIYSGTTRAATTLTIPGTINRALGTKETHSEIITRTIKQGQIWQGSLVVTGQPYLSVFMPLKDINNAVVGMLFVGQPEANVLQSAQQAIRITFAGAALSLILIMILVYIAARRISLQLH